MKALCSHLEARAPAVVSIDKAGAWVFHLARGADALPDLVGMEQLAPS